MLKNRSIRQRILITFLSIIIGGGIIQLLIAGNQLQSATLEFFQHHLETDAVMIASSLSEPIEKIADGEGSRQIQSVLANLQRNTDYDYLLIDANYRILGYTSDRGYENINQVPVTPEIVHASRGNLGSDIRRGYRDVETLFVAVAIQYETHILGYLVLSTPMQPAYLEVYQQWLRLSSATLPVIVMVIVAGLWLAKTISQPLQELRNSALQMAEGALDTRITIDSQDEVGQLGSTLNYMAEQLEALMKTQRHFVSNAAHELRTPLMTIKLRVEALQDDSLPSTEHPQYLQEIRQAIDHMAEMVSALLILARIDEGRTEPDSITQDSLSIIHDIARHWRIRAKEAGVTFEAQIPDDLPDLPLSPSDLRLVLDNLLGNALKYTKHGKINLSIIHKPDEIIMQVRDTGLGFTSEQAEQLFTRFYRSQEARTISEGNGLGLSIVQAVLKQYGASISAKSAGAGQGSSFTITMQR